MRRRARLGRLRQVGAGAFGVVHALDDAPIPLAYKEFTADVDRSARAAERAVHFRARLPRDEREVLDEHFAWPRELVTDGFRVCGYLMPLLTPDYLVELHGGRSEPRSLKWLGATRQQARAAGIQLETLTHTERMEELARLCYSLAFLHRHSWVFGDLSARNAVFRIRPGGLQMLDCDGAAPLDDPARSQGNTPLWEPPEILDGRATLQTAATDVYKLGLAIVRYLQPGTGSGSATSPQRIAGRLDNEGGRLLERALSQDPADRPSASDLYCYLAAAVADRAQPPRIERLAPTRATTLAGRELWLDWRIRGTDQVRVHVPGRRPTGISLARNPDGIAVRPAESGPVRVEARNAFGSAWAETGSIDVWTPPPMRVDRASLPRLEIPTLPAVAAPAIPGATMPAIPTLTAPTLPPIPVGLPTPSDSAAADLVADVFAGLSRAASRARTAVRATRSSWERNDGVWPALARARIDITH